MRPDDETPRDDETPETGPPEDAAGEQEPPPSTYAGRRRAEAGDEDAGDEAGGDAEPDDTEDPGFTEEFDRIERELDAELDELGGGDAEESKDTADDAGDETDAVAAEPEEEAPVAEEVPVDDEDLDEPDADEADATEDAGAGEDEAEPPAGATVEAETVTLADREEAQEAALAGLKARAGDGKAWDTTLHVAAEEDEEKAPRSGRLWPRFLAASLLIIVSMTVATSVSALVELDYWAGELRDNGKLDKAAPWLTQVDAGDPQNILILGSDERLSLPGDKRSDTTILLRVDPDQQAISLLSIPRDLRVSIPNHGIDKFNAAYSYGGPTLTLRTVENLTGVNVNHLVNINFTGFADAVDAIDCVYVDVDRRYYIPEESGVAAINVEAGYQRMCGFNALAYVRYRHDDNDLVRAARQQDFLREARQKVPPWKLWEDRKELLTIFTDHTTSDIDSGVELLELLRTFLGARNAELREVHFPADLGDGTTGYVTASDEAIGSTVKTFLGTEGTPGPPEAGESSESAQREAEQEDEKDDEEKKQRKPEEDKEEDPEPDGPPMENSTDQGQKYAHQISIKKTKGGEPMVTFPIFYPTSLVPGSVITNDTRAFPIDGPDDEKYSGYKMSMQVPGQSFGNGLIYEYYGISGTNWDDPPILENPSETRDIDGRTYDLFWDGDRLRLVAWHDKHDNSYWVNNTLSQSLSGEQMLQIARSMQHDD